MAEHATLKKEDRAKARRNARRSLTPEEIRAALARASEKALVDQRRIEEAKIVTQKSMDLEILI